MATFPVLFGEATNGKAKQWSIRVMEEEGMGVIEVTFGYEGGKLQTQRKVIEEGRNIGKKNQTTPLQQAISEAQAQWIKKKEKGYSVKEVEEDEASEVDGVDEKEQGLVVTSRGKGCDDTVPSVMLAHEYGKRGKSITFPCFVQPKLDGTRCVAVPKKGLFSRNKKRYPHLEHIRAEIDRLSEGMILDGELYSDTLSFQEIVGLVKRETLQPGDEARMAQIKLHVYDMIHATPYQERYLNLQLLFRRFRFRHLVFVPSAMCRSEEDMKAKHAEYVAAGYEGIMLRNRDGLYKGVRSVDLQKYKEFIDQEYEVVGWEEGQGLEKGCVIWLCQTVDGKTFSCRPRGSREDRQQWFLDGESYVGRMLTVRYQEETNDGLPRFPVGIAFRDDL